jgi:3-oxoacyl-[acyl-carrier protein] reductase
VTGELSGKKAIVTGGGRGLGLAIVTRLLEAGAHVCVFDIDPQAVRALAHDCPAVACFTCDVADHAACAAALQRYHDQYGAADIVVNNAGILYSAPLLRVSDKGLEPHDPVMWNKVIAADLTSVFNMSVGVAAKMVTTRTKGVIINISSISASGNAGQSAYAAAKAGVDALTRTWAKELGLYGIRVNSVAPGFADTPSTHAAVNPGLLKDIVGRVPLRRLARAEEIADAVVFVARNGFVNGTIVAVDGGLVI